MPHFPQNHKFRQNQENSSMGGVWTKNHSRRPNDQGRHYRKHRSRNQPKQRLLAVLAELDVQIEAGLKSGPIVRLPNGTRFEPIGKKDGSIDIGVRVSVELEKKVNAGFRGKWVNSDNIGKTEAELVAVWNTEHPDDQLPVD